MQRSISIETHNEAIAAALQEARRLFSQPAIEGPISIEEAVEFTGMAKNTIYNLTCSGDIPFHRRGRLYFYKSELNKWIKSGRCKSTKALRKAQVEKNLIKLPRNGRTGN